MRSHRAVVLCSMMILFISIGRSSAAARVSSPRAAVGAPARAGDDHGVVTVDCAKGQTISAALARGADARLLRVRFLGTCRESPVIDRDDVEIFGIGNSSLLVGLMDIRGSSRVAVHDFAVTTDPAAPFDADHAGINVIQGSSATVSRVQVSNIRSRGVQVDESAAVIEDVSVDGGLGGAFVFHAAQIMFHGNLVATNSLFGVSLLYSAATAKGVNFTFDRDVFSLLIQESSTFEHIMGNLVVSNSTGVGIEVAAQGVFAYGSFIELHHNQNFALQVDELSSFSPLVGAPGGGPSVEVTDNPAIGISIERGSTFELATASTIERNGVGLQVDNSTARLANATITANATDVKLSFAARAELNGGNTFGTPLQCDATVLTHGTFGCGGH